MSRNKMVLICGAGPCGLTVSYVLSQFGIPNMVVEKHPTTSIHPKARGVNVRTMEFMRNWGLEEKIRQHELPQKSRRLLWMDEIQGRVVGEVGLDEENFKYSPTTGCLVPQNFIEDALVEALASSKFSNICFSTKLINFEQQNDQVICHLLDKKTNEEFTVECDYLIAADGAHSNIREALNIQMLGVPSLRTCLTVYAHADLSPWLGDKLAAVYSFTGKDQAGHFLMAVDHKDQWIFGQGLSNTDTPVTEDYCKSIIKSFVNGTDINIQLISHSTWEMAALNATQYRQGRIFLVGDAAHRMPPTGGMGMNTGFAGAQNLAWKLAYVLNDYADEDLLNTYETERQPVATFTLKWSGHNAQRMFRMHEAYREGNMDLFNELVKDQGHHVNHPGLDLGMVYSSDAIYVDNQTPVEINPDIYMPSSMPGMRAPHCEILINNKKTSILNLYQQSYVLLLSENAKVDRKILPIPESYPLKIYRYKIDFDDINHDYVNNYNADQFQAVLVRPDGHIAWRK